MQTPLRQALILAGAVSLLAGSLQAQFNLLTFWPIDAEFSSALDRIVMVSASPNQLSIYDPVANTTQSVALSQPPLSLSLSPNGLYAAVGHQNLISYVNLSTRTVEKTFTVAYTVHLLALGAAHIYVPPYTINIATGASTSIDGSAPYGYTKMRLHPSGDLLFAWFGYSSVTVFSLIGGELSFSRDYSGNASCFSPLLSEDGSRVYAGCNAYQLPPKQSALGTYRGKFVTINYGVQPIDESTAAQRLAVVEQGAQSQTGPPAIQLYDTRYFQSAGRFALPKFVVNSIAYQAAAGWIFFSKDGTAIYAVMRAPFSAGLLQDTAAVATIRFTPSQTPCPVTLTPSSLNVAASGIATEVDIGSETDCIYNASASAAWIEAKAYGSSVKKLKIRVHRNTGASRNGTVTLGDKTVNITQAAAAAPSSLARLPYAMGAWEYSRSLDRMILLGKDVPELLIFDPATETERTVALPLPGNYLSLSPDGKFAVVGHDAWISYVDLAAAKLESTWEADLAAPKPGMNGNGYVYWGAVDVYTDVPLPSYRRLATGITTNIGTGSQALLPHPGGNYFYTAVNWKLDVSTTPPTWKSVSNSTCLPAWFAENGARLYTSCGGVRRITDGSDDLQENGSLGPIQWASNSTARAATAVIAATSGRNADTEVQVYADEGLQLRDRYPLPLLPSDTDTYQTYGRGVFWNAAANRLYTLVTANTPTLTQTFAVATITPGTSPVCTLTLSPASTAFGAAGGTGEFTINTGANCYWSLVTPNFATTSTNYGNGPATIRYTVYGNSGTQSRTGQFVVSGKTLTITQSGLTTAYLLSTPSSTFPTGGGPGYVHVTAAPGYQWTAVSNVPWIVATAGLAGVGSGQVAFSVLANTGARRTGTMTIAGLTATVVQQGITTAGLSFKPIVPCRLMETRAEYNFEGRTGAFGPPMLAAGQKRELPVRESTTCNIPESAQALFVNVTLVPNGPVDYVSVSSYYGGNNIWTVRSPSGLTVANSTIAAVDSSGRIHVFASNATHMVIDVTGYFTNEPYESNLLFYPMTPCRVVETRALYRPETGPFGPPSLVGGVSRRFAFPQSPHCAIPSNAAAYSVTMTAVPSGPLAYLKAWPAGSPQPNVSSMNSPASRILANSVVIPAGNQGAIDLFAYSNTDVLIDINGYFAPDDGSKGLYFFPSGPCRIVDTTSAAFGASNGPPGLLSEAARTFPVSYGCDGNIIPTTAKAYAINMTALPLGQPLPFLTAYPTGSPRPNASQLNAFEGDIVSNSAIVPAGTNRSIDIFAYRATHLVVELNGYFGR